MTMNQLKKKELADRQWNQRFGRAIWRVRTRLKIEADDLPLFKERMLFVEQGIRPVMTHDIKAYALAADMTPNEFLALVAKYLDKPKTKGTK